MCFAVFGGIIVAMGLIYTLVLPNDSFSKMVSHFTSKNILLIGFLISLAAIVSSLVYSNVIGYPPCMLCWYARIFFYPQIILYGRGLLKKDYNILPYSLILTMLGLILTTYHSFIQLTGESILPCTAGGVSCLTRDVYMYGFITIPFMGVVGFGVLLLALCVSKKAAK